MCMDENLCIWKCFFAKFIITFVALMDRVLFYILVCVVFTVGLRNVQGQSAFTGNRIASDAEICQFSVQEVKFALSGDKSFPKKSSEGCFMCVSCQIGQSTVKTLQVVRIPKSMYLVPLFDFRSFFCKYKVSYLTMNLMKFSHRYYVYALKRLLI